MHELRVEARAVIRFLLLVLAALAGAAHAAEPPRRIVTMLPSLAEVVCELGACDRLVGVDDFSNWPEPVRKLPHLGGLEDTNVEGIVALRPDLVLLPVSSRATERLRSLGLRVVSLEPRSLADLQRVFAEVAQLLGAKEGAAAAAWKRVNDGVDAAARELPPALRGTRVYFEVNSGPYAASESSFIGEVLARVGAANVVPASLGPFPKLNPEFVVRADPQVIMVSDRNSQALGTRPGWGRIDALRKGRVCRFTPAQGDVLVRPGPRMPEAAQLMVRCLMGRLQ